MVFLKNFRVGVGRVSQSLMAGSWVSQEVLPAAGCLALRQIFPPSPVTLRGSPSEGSLVSTASGPPSRASGPVGGAQQKSLEEKGRGRRELG